MMSNKNEVPEAYEEGEGQYVEFKVDKDSKKIGETVSAFANTNDGIIIIGVSDRTKDITGIQIGKGTLESIANTIKTNTDPKIFPAWIEPHEFGNKSVIAIKIKENDEKPVFYNSKAFKRVGRTNLRMSVSEMRKLLSESRRIYFDGQICEGATIKEIDEEKVGTYLEKKKEPKPGHLDLETLLLNTNAAKEQNGVIKPTNAGILIFGKNPQRFLLHSQLRVARFSGETMTSDFIDRLDPKGTLWEMANLTVEFIRKNMRIEEIRTSYSLERVGFEFPMKVIREGIMNAIIHRDYRETSDTRVLMFPDRIEIINSGTFPTGTTPENPRHIPVNPVICELMYAFGYVEKYGTGILMMKDECKRNGIPDPIYEITETETKLIFNLPKAVISIPALERAGIELKDRQKAALLRIFAEGSITNKKYREEYNVSQKTAFLELSDLVEKGILIRKGEGRATKYEPKI